MSTAAPVALRVAACVAACATLLSLGACDRFQSGSTVAVPAHPAVGDETIAAVPLGDVAGAASTHLPAALGNPYGDDNAQAIAQGKELFIAMNCAGCHGYGATGGMGPNLNDKYWRYGGAPANIFKSIYEGRPQGMPAWNPALPPREIWKLVAYIESLGGAYPPKNYQAWLQGDRVGDNVPPSVTPTAKPLPKDFPQKSKASSGAADPQARFDAGGTPPAGDKPGAGGENARPSEGSIGANAPSQGQRTPGGQP